MGNNKVLMVYPNLSMLLAPPLSYAIFTVLLRKEGHEVDIFDVTPYVGEGERIIIEVADRIRLGIKSGKFNFFNSNGMVQIKK